MPIIPTNEPAMYLVPSNRLKKGENLTTPMNGQKLKVMTVMEKVQVSAVMAEVMKIKR